MKHIFVRSNVPIFILIVAAVFMTSWITLESYSSGIANVGAVILSALIVINTITNFSAAFKENIPRWFILSANSILLLAIVFINEQKVSSAILFSSFLFYISYTVYTLAENNVSKASESFRILSLVTLFFLAINPWISFILEGWSFYYITIDTAKYFPVISFVCVIGVLMETDRKNRLTLANANKTTEELNWVTVLINLISHNVRTPLTTAVSTAQIMRLKAENSQEASVSVDDLDRLDDSLEQTSEIIQRLLRAANLKDGMLRISPEEMLERFKNAYPGIIISGQHATSINDLGLAHQLALEVFLDNAIKHGGEKVELRFEEKEIIIKDNGSGMTEDNISQFDADRMRYDAQQNLHGIGINFAQRVLDAVGWRCYAEKIDEGFQIRMVPISAA